MSRWWWPFLAVVLLVGSVTGAGGADDLPVLDPRGYDINGVEPQQLLVAGDVVVWIIGCEDDEEALCAYGPLDRRVVSDETPPAPPSESFRLDRPTAWLEVVTHRADGSVWVTLDATAAVGIDRQGNQLGPVEVEVPAGADCEAFLTLPDAAADDVFWLGCEKAVLQVTASGTVVRRHPLDLADLTWMVARPSGGVMVFADIHVSIVDSAGLRDTSTIESGFNRVASNPAVGVAVVGFSDCDPLCDPQPPSPDPDKPAVSDKHYVEFPVTRLDWDGNIVMDPVVVGTGPSEEGVVAALLADGRTVVSLPPRQLVDGNPDALGAPLVMIETDGTVTEWNPDPAGRVCCADALAAGWDGLLEVSSIDGVARFRRWAIDPFGTFMDDDASPFEEEIETIATSGVTAGCHESGLLFCPGESVTRAQMATFLARFLGLALNAPDAFADDDGSVHEASINAVAAAGITAGCDPVEPALYCPNDPVNRAQMATLLARALELPPGPDRFTDDDGSVHEASIAALAAAGITNGCDATDPTRFCPISEIRRDQMAALLVRSSG